MANTTESLQEKLTRLRNNDLEEELASLALEPKKHQVAVNRAEEVIEDVYQVLHKLIYRGMGVGYWEDIDVDKDLRCYQSSAFDGKLFRTTLKQVKILTGLEIRFEKNPGAEYDFSLAKYCMDVRTCYDPEVFLRQDFVELFAEAERRDQLWKTHLPAFAKHCVEQCKKKLDAKIDAGFSTRAYMTVGIDLSISARISEVTNSFSFDNLRVDYDNLTLSRRKELFVEMNKLIVGGEIDISEHLRKSSCNYLTINEAITRSPNLHPVLYFGEFCKKVRKWVPPEVKQLIDAIPNNLQTPAEASQVRNLAPKHTLAFVWEDGALEVSPSWLIERSTLWRKVVKAVERKMGVTVTNSFIEGPALRSLFKQDRYECRFEYSIPYGANSEFCKQQLEIERKISDIISTKVNYVAKWFANWIMDRINGGVHDPVDDGHTKFELNSSDKDERTYRWLYNAAGPHFLIPLDDPFTGLSIDLLKANRGFYCAICTRIEEITDGQLSYCVRHTFTDGDTIYITVKKT